MNRLAIGYGYDLEKNKTNIVADFAQAEITLPMFTFIRPFYRPQWPMFL
jgi:hypothetical protein